MAFAMTRLTRRKSGAFSARKSIPKDVRDEYRTHFGGGWEERFYAQAGTPLGEAKAALSEWLAKIEARITAIRDGAAGQSRSLTLREALALAGEWYLWFVQRHEDDPGDPEYWDALLDEIRHELLHHAPEWFEKSYSADPNPDWTWTQDEDVRVAMRPLIADKAKTAKFLVSRGLALTAEARDRFLDAVETEYIAALQLLMLRGSGDYSRDNRPERFPKFAPVSLKSPSARSSPSGPSCFELFEAWIKAGQPRPSTITRWRAVFLNLQSRFADRSASSITQEEANEWKDELITKKRSARTVSDIWLAAARTVFAWGLKERLIHTNPFIGVTVTVPKKRRLRETDAFTPKEVQQILGATLAITDITRPFPAACRWVPWLCAYTGARAGEITQLRGVDVIERDGVDALRLTPDAGTIKTGATRTIPIHEHLIVQGFLDFVATRGEGPLFYNPERAGEAGADPTNPRRPRAVKTRERLARWVRRAGVTDILRHQCERPPLRVGRRLGSAPHADMPASPPHGFC
jgi:integrase